MAKILNNTRVVTNEVRASYAHIAEPVSVNGGEPKYSMSIIIPKDDTETLNLIDTAIDKAIAAGVNKFGGKKPSKGMLKLPLRDGDIERDDEAYENAYFINCNNKTQPQVVDVNRHALDPSNIYSGCYCKVSIQFYAFNVGGSKGVAAALGNIQFIRDGEPLGSMRITAADDFGAADDDDFLA